ncbi:TetR family transcriptional regulator [Demetria terragena]|uniref:TetR family transcriptional regulator n=1 Tax=Demetria terragena TaxID=63959 RepID=UPI0006889CF2|nr:TetR family transcriptional regulator [Demetria terragena]
MSQSEAGRASARTPDIEARDRLVEAARVAFGNNGFHGTTTRHIAAAAGMSPAAVYVHHPSKEALLYALSLAGHTATLADVTAAEASSADPVEQVYAIVRAFVLREAEQHATARIVNYELDALTTEHRVEIDDLRRQIQDTLQSAIERGMNSGQLDCAEPTMTAVSVMGMSIDVGRWYRDEGRWTPAEVADHHADLALRMVGAQRGERPSRQR